MIIRIMDNQVYFVQFVFFAQIVGVLGTFNSFMDNVYFSIDWPGPLDLLKVPGDGDKGKLSDEKSVTITTNNNEKYHCILPTVLEEEQKDDEGTESALMELDLLRPLFDQTTCTYRLETYWTYELCHGRHLRQYHEEKELGKKPKLQEYFLGRYKMDTFWKDYQEAKKQLLNPDKTLNTSRKIQKVQGIEIPYFEVVYTDGTVCDLTGQPRKAFLHYVCQPDGRGEIYELKETSSCEYEVVVLSNLLCAHPAYGPKKEPTNTIHCHSLDGSPTRPANLEVFEREIAFDQFYSKQYWDEDSSSNQHGFHEKVSTSDPDAKQQSSLTQKTRSDPSHSATQPPPQLPVDNQIVKDFVEGTFCIEGGAGWWKHKFCYGRHVIQYHVDDQRKDTIVLGEWNQAAHLGWIKMNPVKKPKPSAERKSLSQFYGDGDTCEITGRRRFVEVKLQCISNPVHPNAVSIYLSEPKTCEYKLVVESLVFCSLITQADDNGLITNPSL